MELLLFLLFEVIFRKRFQVNLRDLFIFAVEFIKLFNRIRLILSIRRVVSEFLSLTMNLIGDFLTFLAVSEVESFTSSDLYKIKLLARIYG